MQDVYAFFVAEITYGQKPRLNPGAVKTHGGLKIWQGGSTPQPPSTRSLFWSIDHFHSESG